MAQAQPCIRCEAGESAWALTARDDSTGMEAGTTLFLCNTCWLGFVLEWAEAVTQAAQSPETPEPAAEPADTWEYEEPQPPKRNGKKANAVEQGAGDVQEAQAETADVGE